MVKEAANGGLGEKLLHCPWDHFMETTPVSASFIFDVVVLVCFRVWSSSAAHYHTTQSSESEILFREWDGSGFRDGFGKGTRMAGG